MDELDQFTTSEAGINVNAALFFVNVINPERVVSSCIGEASHCQIGVQQKEQITFASPFQSKCKVNPW